MVGDPVYVTSNRDDKPHTSGAVGSTIVEAAASRWHAYTRYDEEDDEVSHLVVVRGGEGLERKSERLTEVARIRVDGGCPAAMEEPERER